MCRAIATGQVHVSEHAYDEAVEDNLAIVAVLEETPNGETIEDYPNDPRSPSCLVLLTLGEGSIVHAVWAFDGRTDRAILITVYRPDPNRWSDDFKQRRPKT